MTTKMAPVFPGDYSTCCDAILCGVQLPSEWLPHERLMRAAPELLAACHQAHRWIEKLTSDADFVELPEALLGLLVDHQETLAAAIAKATEGR